MLYRGVRQQVAKHLAAQCAAELVPLFPLGSEPGNIEWEVGTLRPGDTSKTPLAANERFLSAVTRVWDDHCACMSKLRDVLKYVDRVYVPNQRVAPIWELGLEVFRDTVVLQPACRTNLLVMMLRQIHSEREGASVERRTLKAVADMLLALSTGSDRDGTATVYARDFEPLLLSTSAEYYAAEALRLLATRQATYYLAQAERRFAEEDGRVAACLSPATRAPLRALLERHLLMTHLDAILDMPDGGLVALLDADARGELARMYRLVRMVPPGLDALNRALREYTRERGRTVNESLAPRSDVPPADAAAAPLRWVEQVLAIKARLDGVLATSFASDKSCEAAMNEAFDSFVNMNARAPEFLSLFIDEHLKRGARAAGDDVERVLDQTIAVFRFVHEKDVFERYYKMHLTRRLLHGRSVSDDAERGMIAKLKVECGHDYVQKLQGMLNDMKMSEDINTTFAARHSSALPFQMNVHVLTATYWPVSAPPQPVTLPPALVEACTVFEQFYGGRHRGRVLTWQPALGTAEVRVRFRARTHELVLSTYALMVLLLFEHVPDGTPLSYRDMLGSTHMPEGDLQRTLQSLACTKYKVLRKEPRGRDVHESDVFYFNADFTCPLTRIKIAQVAAKAETSAERKETTAKVEEERKNQVEVRFVPGMTDAGVHCADHEEPQEAFAQRPCE